MTKTAITGVSVATDGDSDKGADAASSVVITGANGFIGSAMTRLLHARGYKVRPCARLSQGTEAEEPRWIQVKGLDVDSDWRPVLAGADAVIHTAARVHVLRETTADPLAGFRVANVDGTLNLARQAAHAGVRRFVFLSSLGVNGSRMRDHPFRPDDRPAPNSPYAQSKLEAEQGLEALGRQTDMEIVVIRPPMVYGPNAPGNFDVLVRWMRRGVPLPLGAATQNRRSFVALDNLLDLIATCLVHPAAAGQTFMVSDGEDLSTAILLQKIGLAMGKPARLVSVPVPMLRLCAKLIGKSQLAERLLDSLQVDITKTRELLGWIPPISVSEGLSRAVAESAS